MHLKSILLGILMLGIAARTGAAVPALMNYQGRISVGGIEFTGTGGFKFAFIRGADGETLWSNDGTLERDVEPTAEVSLTVNGGFFAVLLGDTGLPNMRPLTADLFAASPDVRLRVWFNDGLNGSFQLSPDTFLGSVPYAMSANLSEQSITGAHLAAGSVDPAKLAGDNTPEPGWVLGFDGAGFHWSPPYASPAVLRSTRAGVPDQFLQMEGGDPASIRLTAQSVAGAEKPLVIRNLSGEATPGENNAIEFALGTSNSPSTKMTLTKDGNVLMRPGGSGGTIQFGTPNFETGMTVVGANRADVRFDGSTLKLLAQEGRSIPPPENGVSIHTSGNVGIGTSDPQSKLHVQAPGVAEMTIRSPSERVGLVLDGTLNGQNRVWTVENGMFGSPGLFGVYDRTAARAALAITPGARVGIGTTEPAARLHVDDLGSIAVRARGRAGGIGVWGESEGGLAFLAEGHAHQSYDKGGFVKAMVHVRHDGRIIRCHNGTLTTVSEQNGDCGFTCTTPQDGVYRIDFGFPVRERFLSITTQYKSVSSPDNHTGANYEFDADPDVVKVFTFSTVEPDDTDSTAFMILVF